MAKPKKKRSGIFGPFIIIVTALSLFAIYRIFGPNTGTFTEGEYLYVHTGSDYQALKKALEDGGFVSDMFSFDLLARSRNLPLMCTRVSTK